MIHIFTNPCLAISDMTADFLLSLLLMIMIIMMIMMITTTINILTMTNNNHDLNPPMPSQPRAFFVVAAETGGSSIRQTDNDHDYYFWTITIRKIGDFISIWTRLHFFLSFDRSWIGKVLKSVS